MRSFSKSSSASDNSAGPPSPANFALSTRQADKLRSRLARTSTFESEEEHAHHGHGSKPSSLVAATVSGVINWVLMFGLCCAYGMIMFSDEWHAQHRSLGVSMNLATATLLGLILALRSKIGVAIGGPDLNPVVFLAGFVEVIGVDLAHQLGLDHPAAADRRLGGTFARFLGGTSSYGTEFCTGKDLIVHAEECQSYHAQLRATVIFTTAVSSLLLAVVFLIIGRLRVARFVSYVPTCIMEAFLSCVGYKVFMYALKFCKFQPVQFIPAAVIGVLVYFLKAQHVGNPAVMIPTLLFLPLGCFYAYIYGSGMDLEEARADKLMFPEMDDVAFWSVWAETLGNSGLINIKAWAKTLPDLVIMVIVCVLDCLLKVSSTESKLPVIPDKDYEVQLYGWSNFLTAACGSSVGYMQLKFNVINFGIVGNVVDRRAGLVYAALSALCYFWTIEHFNLLPRFFLSALLFFAGAGFVAENLWGSRQFLSFREWMQILIILIVFILTEALLYAVVAGAILCCIDAIKTYTTIPCILGAPQRGGEFATYTRCDVALQVMLQHIANKWLLVVRLKGFLFFGSVQGTLAYLRTQIEEQRNLPKFRRLRYIAFDCRLLDGMDASASKDIRRLKHDAMKVGISLFWTNLQPHVLEDMQIRSILHSENEWFSEFSDCLLFVERQALDYLAKMQSRWVQVHPAFALYQQQARLQTGFEPFRDILTMDTVRHGCPWKYCSRIELKGNETVLWKPGRRGKGLMLVHSGSVGLFRSLPKDGEGFEFPIAVYQQGWFINREALTGAATQHYAVALEDGQAICWNERDFFSMTRQRPSMAAAISKAVMRQQVHDGQMLDRQSQNERGVDATASMTAGGEAVTVQVPDQLEYRVDAFQTASWLQSYGLFDSPSELASADTGAAEAPLPVLPTQFENDLREAFHVYRDSVSEPHHLPKDMVRNALLYAGVTNAVLENESFVDPTADEFLHIANDAVMARFSEQQLETIRKVFAHFDDDDSGFLDASELHEVLRKTFHPTISIEEIDAISSFWDNDGSGKIELEEFSDIIARFVRHLEQEWSVLRAFQEISGRGVEEMRDSWGDWWLTVDMVRDQTTLSESDVEELFWAAGLDPRTSAGSEGPRLLLRDALVALLVDARGSSGRLPPLPLKKGSKPVAPLKATPVLGFVRNSPKRGHAGSPKRNQQRTEPVSPLSAPPDFADVPEAYGARGARSLSTVLQASGRLVIDGAPVGHFFTLARAPSTCN
eukprot:TRINITY_DN3120_c0_g1_i2.p1 TRINITY_DN3120_c0_g1~~TRINITY_DN3120_c0_g1_i2.p1  ORF type:complete len:1305 (-),score=253.39 TRINITY_DN3120_c0_g1_i2:1124-4846(-)